MASSARKIVIALDGSPTSMYALDWFSEWFVKDKDDVQFFHCSEPESSNTFFKSSGNKSQGQTVDVLQNLQEVAGTVLFKCSVINVACHKPGEAIVKACEDCKADILIIGARGHRPYNKKHIIGSTAHYVMQNLRLPTIICQLPAEPTT